MPTIKYCDYINGHDDTGNGSYGNPYKTITTASIGLTGGDEVRVAKSPAATALTGTLTFTNASTAVTGSGTAFTTELAIGDFILGGDGGWYEVVTITNDTTVALYKIYPGTTASGVSSQKLGVTSTGEAASSTTVVQTVSVSGTSSSNLKISGGWTLATQTQDGQTYFRQMHGTFANRYGYGLYFSSKNYTTIGRLNFLRYNSGICYSSNSSNNTATSPICNSNSSYGIYYSSNSSNNTATSPICNSNSYYGIYYISSNNNTATSPICNSNSSYGIYYSSNNNTATNISTTGNATAGVYNDIGIIYISHGTIAETLKVSAGTNYSNCRTYITAYGNDPLDNRIYTDNGYVCSQVATRHTASGMAWQLQPTNVKRDVNYPLKLSVAKIAVVANKAVTVKAWMKLSNTSDILGKLIVKGGQLAGVTTDVESNASTADTDWHEVTLADFTPTEVGVIEVECWAWWVANTADESVYIDDMTITQAT